MCRAAHFRKTRIHFTNRFHSLKFLTQRKFIPAAHLFAFRTFPSARIPRAIFSFVSHLSNLQHFLKVRQIFCATGRDERNVFQPHAADFRIIKSRLNGHDVAAAQNFR